MRLLAVLAFVAGLILVPAGAACACSCAPFEARRAVAEAEAIVAGTVVDVRSTGGQWDPVVATIRPDQVYKGAPRDTYEISTSSNSAACGFEFVKGTRYLLFAHANTGEDHPYYAEGIDLATLLCSGNQVLKAGTAPITQADLPADLKEADALLTALGAPTAPPSGNASPSGSPSPVSVAPVSSESPLPAMGIGIGIGAAILLALILVLRLRRS